MAAGSQRTEANPYFSFSYNGSMAFDLAAKAAGPAKRGRGQAISYSLKPSFEWSVTPRTVKFRFARPDRKGSISWRVV